MELWISIMELWISIIQLWISLINYGYQSFISILLKKDGFKFQYAIIATHNAMKDIHN